MNYFRLLAGSILAALLIGSAAFGQTKKRTYDPEKEFVIGQSLSLKGHFQLYGSIIQSGIETAFKRINKQGGVKGKQLRLLSMDDGGDADKTVKNIQKMNQLGIKHFIGVMGTRGILGILPEIKSGKIGCYFPWGGDRNTRNKDVKGIINGPGLLDPQLDELKKYIVTTHKMSRIVIFHADDDFSTNAASKLEEILSAQGTKILGKVNYNRFNFDLTSAVKKISELDPRMIVCVSTSTPAVRLINELLMHGLYGIMFCGIDSTFMVPHIIKSKGINFKCTAIVPDPEHDKSLLVKQYREDIAEFCPEEKPNPLSLTYYLCGRLVAEAIEQSEKPSVETIIKYFEGIKEQSYLGFPLHFNPENRHLFGEQTWMF